MLPVAQSSSDDNAIHYLCPVLWTTSRFHIMGQIQKQASGELFAVTRQVVQEAVCCHLTAFVKFYVTRAPVSSR